MNLHRIIILALCLYEYASRSLSDISEAVPTTITSDWYHESQKLVDIFHITHIRDESDSLWNVALYTASSLLNTKEHLKARSRWGNFYILHCIDTQNGKTFRIQGRFNGPI
jgi:hypothetical protein